MKLSDTAMIFILTFMVGASAQQTQTITTKRIGSGAATRAPADNFTGSVHIEPMFPAAEPSRLSASSVTFEPGARTAWHTHPLGQTLIVTAGIGWVQQRGGRVQEIRQGDVVRIPPDTKHWHGATETSRMTHIALQEAHNGRAVDWLQKVSDQEYRQKGDQ